ncbi:MAG: LysE family translocator [Pseudomonadota bacterium]
MTIEWHQLALYALAYFVTVVTPGPFIAAIAARSAAYGFKSGVSLATGAWVGDKIWILAAIFGLAVIAQHYADILTILRFIGAAWLIWIGVKLLSGRSGMIKAEDGTVKREPFWQGTLTGLMLMLGNPKAALFFMALFPGFFDVAAMTWVDAVIILAVSAPIGLGCDLSWAWAADRARRFFADGPAARRVDQAMGGVLAGAGVAIATV